MIVMMSIDTDQGGVPDLSKPRGFILSQPKDSVEGGFYENGKGLDEGGKPAMVMLVLSRDLEDGAGEVEMKAELKERKAELYVILTMMVFPCAIN